MIEKHPMIGGIITEVTDGDECIRVNVPNGKEYWLTGGYFRIAVTRSK